MHACISHSTKNNLSKFENKLGIWLRIMCLRSHQRKGTEFVAPRSDMIPCQSKSSPNDLACAEPRVQLDAEECCDTGVLDFQIVPVLPQLLHLIKLFPECFIATRKAERSMCQFKDTVE